MPRVPAPYLAEPVRDEPATQPTSPTSPTSPTATPSPVAPLAPEALTDAVAPTTRPPEVVEEVYQEGRPAFFGSGGGGGGGMMAEEEVVEDKRLAEVPENSEADKAYRKQKMIIFGLIGIAVLIAGILIYRRIKKGKK